tara:strand:- start:50 stop:304 length:255 start_codon:yes stop_codon:yes gene_type:complete
MDQLLSRIVEAGETLPKEHIKEEIQSGRTRDRLDEGGLLLVYETEIYYAVEEDFSAVDCPYDRMGPHLRAAAAVAMRRHWGIEV